MSLRDRECGVQDFTSTSGLDQTMVDVELPGGTIDDWEKAFEPALSLREWEVG